MRRLRRVYASVAPATRDVGSSTPSNVVGSPRQVRADLHWGLRSHNSPMYMASNGIGDAVQHPGMGGNGSVPFASATTAGSDEWSEGQASKAMLSAATRLNW